mgnify:CR=1 FL=1
MTLTEQVFAQAQLLAGPMEQRDLEMLRLLCRASVKGLQNRLRKSVTADDCKADFVAAASLYALGAMAEAAQGQLTEFSVGDVTMKRPGGDTASKCLHAQAELIMAPYLQGRFSFRGV